MADREIKLLIRLIGPILYELSTEAIHATRGPDREDTVALPPAAERACQMFAAGTGDLPIRESIH